MAFLSTTQFKAAFKLLFGKTHTSNDKELVNEAKSGWVQLAATQIFGQEIPENPATAVSTGIAEYVECDLVLDSTSNGLSYQAVYPTGHAKAGQSVKSIIPSSFGSGYRAILLSNGSEITPLDSRNWFLTTSSGVVTSETALALVSGKLQCWIYIGKTVQESMASSTGNVNTHTKRVTLIANDITNQYVDMDHSANYGMFFFFVGGVCQLQTIDYELSEENGKTRVTFINDLATGGASELVEGDFLVFQYIYY